MTLIALLDSIHRKALSLTTSQLRSANSNHNNAPSLKMALPKRVLLIGGLAFTGLISLLYVASSIILVNNLKQAEEQSARQVMTGVLNVFQHTQADLDSRCIDWATWDDTYTFVQDVNQQYIQSNLSAEMLANLKINLVMFVQPSGQIVFAKGLDWETLKPISVSATLHKHLNPNGLLLQRSQAKQGTMGMLLLPEGPLLVVARPILTSQGEGPAKGTLIFGRYLDHKGITELSEIARLPLTIHRVNHPQLPADVQVARQSVVNQSNIGVHPLNQQTLAGYIALKDLYSQPTLLLQAEIPREIYIQGRKGLQYLMMSLVVLGVLFGGIAVWLLEQLAHFHQKQLQAEERYRTIFENAVEGIFQTTPEGQYINANPALARIYGYASAEHLIDSLTNVTQQLYVDPHRRQEFVKQVEQHGSVSSFESQIYRQDGSTAWIAESARGVRDAEGKLLYYEGFVQDITERKQVQAQLLHDALHDALTDLPNRTLFVDRLGHVLQLAQQHNHYLFAVLFLDLDRFKVINDSLGHLVGDQLLVAIAHRLQQYLQINDTFVRLGGDEFAILLEDLASEAQAIELAEQIQQALKFPFRLGEREIFATASIGIILNTQSYNCPEDLLRDADIAMYQAKIAGPGCYQVFDVTMHDRAVARLQLETDLRQALEQQALEVYYQPIISLRNNQLVGFEALARWQHPTRGWISPAEFIPVAEEAGLIIPLGAWVLQEACRQMRVWQLQFPQEPPLKISVNISGRQFSQTRLVEQVANILQETGLDPYSLKLEITESVVMENAEAAIAVLKKMRSLGIGISIDDFGTGYSSLGYLNRLPIDTLKIDRSFVNSVDTDAEKMEIIRTVVSLAWNLGLDVIAEGVETNRQLSQLKALHCEYAQGYLFAKPLSSIDAAAFITAVSSPVS